MKVKRFGQYSLEESLVDDFILSVSDSLNEQSTDEASEIIKKFKEKFGENKPSNQEFADFYHELRTLEEAMKGADIFLGLSAKNVVTQLW